MKRTVVVLMCLALVAGMAFAEGQKEKQTTVHVASQNVNETVILAHMAKILIEEKTDLNATVNTEFSGSSVLHQAMVGNEIDVYPTWTGTQLTGILRYEGPNLSSEEAYRRVKEGFEKQFGMTWSKPLGFNNTYIFVVRKETADKYNLKVASDLAPYAAKWQLAGDENFDTRSDAYPGWSAHYGITFKKVLPMQYGLMYRALAQGEVDAAVAYSTDSRIKKMNLVMLEDDKGFFPDYSGAYVINQDLLASHPEVLDVLNSLGGKISTATQGGLNARYDDGEDPAVIARDFLKQNGLIE